ncbi:MAG: penicillin-binding protein 2 [Bernardetiaceae bacterium]
MELNQQTYFIQAAIILIFGIFVFRLYQVQVSDDTYARRAFEKTTIKVVDYPQRGLVYDRNGALMVSNIPVFNVQIIANDLVIPDTALLCQLLQVPIDELRQHLQKARRGIQRYQPYTLKSQVHVEEHAQLEAHLIDFEGIYTEASTIRRYPFRSFAHGIGYVKEVDARIIKRDTTQYYRQGDLIGRTGLEQTYEVQLRGQRGNKRYIRSARGVQKDFDADPDATTAQVGLDLVSTIDAQLQSYGERLMQNKRGAIVAIEPKTGEILALISAPTYDPNLLTGSGLKVSQNFQALLNDPNKPLFNRATMATYPPGSTFKLLQALIALEEGVIDPFTTRIACTQEVVKCHGHPSPTDVHGSIQHSCNPFYLKVFRRIVDQENTRDGLTKWKDYMTSFGLGQPLGIDITEKPGLIPSVAYYDSKYKAPHTWRVSNIYSLSIGQGEVNLTPVQMANVAAMIANGGYYITPHLVRKIGRYQEQDSLIWPRHLPKVSAEHFPVLQRAMIDVVRAGTARRAQIPEITVCGKTGTIQNPHGNDHSAFIAFAPYEDPQIAIAVYVENAGFGGTWAAPIASLMMEQYLKGTVTQTYKEQRILEADLITPPKKLPKPKATPSDSTLLTQRMD